VKRGEVMMRENVAELRVYLSDDDVFVKKKEF
jgi:hypothetical protein